LDAKLELESQLLFKRKQELRDMARKIIPVGMSCIFVRQAEPLGLGHAVLCADSAVGNNPFTVFLANDLMRGQLSPAEALVETLGRTRHSVLSVKEVPLEDVSPYWVVRLGAVALDGVISVEGLV
jgi:UTP--glucose-1-phosphate uridylyltransferase